MARQRRLVDQLPMGFMLPDTSWVAPTSLPDMRGEGDLACDLETRDDGLAADRGPAWFRHGGFVTGVTLTSSVRSVYVPVRAPDTHCMDHTAIGDWLRDHMAGSGRRVFHSAPYDLGWMWAEWDIPPPENLHDSQAAAFIVDENQLRYGLDYVCKREGIAGKDESLLRQAAEAFGYNPKSEMWKLPARYYAPYAEQDGRATLQLDKKLQGRIAEQGLERAYQLEVDLLPMVIEMRRRGIRVNTNRAEENMGILLARSREMLVRLEDKVQIGRSIQIEDIHNSRWMADVFTRAGISYPRTPLGKQDSFANEWMAREERYSIPWLCARADQFHEAANKFIKNYILSFTHMGRIHAEIHSYKSDEGGARTTRFSYSDPPLQQMSSKDEEIAPYVRGCLEPEEGEIWATVDYSQQEYRLMTHFAYVCKMAGADVSVAKYRADPDTDFHNMVVEITGLTRRKAKDVNFAKAFGAGVAKFASMVNIPHEEAKQQMEQYDQYMPWVKRFGEFMQKRADRRGYVIMIDGMRGRFDDWEPRWLDYRRTQELLKDIQARGLPTPPMAPCSLDEAQRRRDDPDHPWYGERLKRAKTHKAMNKLVQGSAARQMKMAMRECWRQGIVPMLQMHDDLNLSVSACEVADRVAEIMVAVVKLEIPVKCDVEFGVNWGRAVKNKATGYMATWEEALALR